jgi:hypothetical protein
VSNVFLVLPARLPAVSEASADAVASTFIESFHKGRGRKPSFSECEAAASADASAFSFGREAFTLAKAVAEAAAKSSGWKGKFLTECKAKASASSISFGGGKFGDSFASERSCLL